MKKSIKLLLMGLIVLFIAACGADSDSEEGSSEETDETEIVTVEHELGTTDVEKNPEKVVVFDFGSLDTLDKLGIDVVGVPQINIPDYLSDYATDDYENVGSLKEPDFEKIAEIDPDLIIISGRQAELLDELEKLGPTIYLDVDTTNYMESFESNVRVIGEIFDKEDEVETEFAALTDLIDSTKEVAEEHGGDALIILANDDKISAYGANSRFGLIHDVLDIAPVDEDIEVATHGMNVSFEYVVEQDPDLLYVIDRGAAIGEEASAKAIVENKLVEKTKAYKNDDIYYLNPEYWYLSGGGLQSVEAMVLEIEESLQ